MARKQDGLAGKVTALGDAANLADGRSNPETVAQAKDVVARADRRLKFSGELTVIALGGATGSGKSSLFNALSESSFAEVDVKRPTTSKSMAVHWGSSEPTEILNWLDVPRRHLINQPKSELTGLILLDLPDHDSTEAAHRLEVDRLVALVDGFVWVVDPQKYADNALHERYLRPYSDYADVMLIVLNQTDRLTPEQLQIALADLRRLLDSEGLQAAQIVAVSALTGQGIPELRSRLVKIAKAKKLAAERLRTDVERAGQALKAELGGSSGELSAASLRRLDQALGEAAGIPLAKKAVQDSVNHRGAVATGWPLTAWIGRLKPDPLKKLKLDQVPKKQELEFTPARTGIGQDAVATAQVSTAVRALSDEASAGMPAGWALAVREASTSSVAHLPDQLDQAIATTPLHVDRVGGWWKAISFFHWLFILVGVVGIGWLTVDFVFSYLQLPPLPKYHLRGIPLPTWLILGSVVSGVLLSLFARLGVRVGARTKAEVAERALQKSIHQVAEALVVEPINRELARYSAAKSAAQKVLG